MALQRLSGVSTEIESKLVLRHWSGSDAHMAATATIAAMTGEHDARR